MTPIPGKWRSAVLTLGAAAALSGCAGTNPRDPYEGFNRAMFKFNDTVDQVALKPAATAYRAVLPSFVQTGVNNFFGNLADAWSAVNNLLQGKGEAGMSDVTRFTLNSTFGLLGLLDIASEAGLPKHNEDFGQTLGYWGVPSGPYLMLPLFGASTVRDTAALPLDFNGDIWRYKEPIYLRNIGTATRAVDQRANLLDASSLLEDAALDRYEFVRDGFLQRRESKVYDGEDPPRKRRPKDDDDGVKKVDSGETSAPVSSEPAPKELNSETPAAKTDSL
jgi:phospholipid-binding lipoprotein MlaA